jgi:hypothetical protein
LVLKDPAGQADASRVKQRWIAVAGALAVLSACGGASSTPQRVKVSAPMPPVPDSPSAAAPSCPPSTAGARLAPTGPGTYFGVNLDWDRDRPAALAARLGHRPAVYVAFAPFPLSGSAAGFIDGIAGGLVGEHAALMLTLEPNGGLAAVTPAASADLAARLAGYNRKGVPVFVRFAHEMNGSWYPWAQQPIEYVAAFRTLAAAVHAAARGSAMMWAPNYGGGYPFAGGKYEAQPGSADFRRLDTNHDGKLSMADDPYAPYYPGDDAADWVGMSLYHWGDRYPWGANAAPEPGKFLALLTGEYNGDNGDETQVPDFYTEFGVDHHKPVAITETSAFYAPGRPGDDGAIKQAWWRQVFDPTVASHFPDVRMINWFEWDKYESQVNAEVDWTVTRRPALVSAFRTALPSWLLWSGSVPDC